MNREQAWDLLTRYNHEPFHLRHGITVEHVMGWYAQQPEVIRDRVRRYGNTDGNMVSLDFIRFCMASIAKYAIFPIQDLCLMGSDARMNTPGVAAANWAFRYVKEDLTQERKNWLLKTTRLFGRCPLGPEDYTV